MPTTARARRSLSPCWWVCSKKRCCGATCSSRWLARSAFGGPALILSVAFGLLHGGNAGETPLGLLGAGAGGLLFCLSLWYTKSLMGRGFHTGFGWGESYFYGTANSGQVIPWPLFATHSIGDSLWERRISGTGGQPASAAAPDGTAGRHVCLVGPRQAGSGACASNGRPAGASVRGHASRKDLPPCLRASARRLDILIASRKLSARGNQPLASFLVMKRIALSARACFSVSCGGLDEKYVRTTTEPACSPVICTTQSTPGRDGPVGCLK